MCWLMLGFAWGHYDPASATELKVCISNFSVMRGSAYVDLFSSRIKQALRCHDVDYLGSYLVL